MNTEFTETKCSNEYENDNHESKQTCSEHEQTTHHLLHLTRQLAHLNNDHLQFLIYINI